MRRVTVLGSTGSIGTQALDVIGRNRDGFSVTGLAARGGDPALLVRQVLAHDVRLVAVTDEPAAVQVRAGLAAAGHRAEILAGEAAATELAGADTDVVLNGLAGAVGLRPTLAALRAGSILALANKESLIIGGALVQGIAAPEQVVPVDSEHSALAQCLRGGRAEEVRRLVLTASGGPFRGRDRDSLADVGPEQALAHPTWSMGPLVTTNSATLLNKGLEVIEAHLLFDIGFDRIDVVVHPQSVVHSMVEFIDGSTLAQVSPPDMRLPIALGLAWPDRIADAAPGCSWTEAATWTFEPVDEVTFPALALARQAGQAGGVMPAVLNAANEVCVAAFLDGNLRFLQIVDTVADVLTEAHDAGLPAPRDVEDVMAADAWARERAAATLARLR